MSADPRGPSGTGHDTARLLGHKPEDVCFEDGKWSIICECAWECWDQPDEERAWDFYNTHVEDDVHPPSRRTIPSSGSSVTAVTETASTRTTSGLSCAVTGAPVPDSLRSALSAETTERSATSVAADPVVSPAAPGDSIINTAPALARAVLAGEEDAQPPEEMTPEEIRRADEIGPPDFLLGDDFDAENGAGASDELRRIAEENTRG